MKDLSRPMWFLAGAGLAFGVGLLVVPQSGEKTRRYLRRSAKRTQRVLESKLSAGVDPMQDLAWQAEEWIDITAKNVKRIPEGLSHRIEAGKAAYDALMRRA